MPSPKWEMTATLAYPAQQVWQVLSGITPGRHIIDDLPVLATAGILEPGTPVRITEKRKHCFTVTSEADTSTAITVAVDHSAMTVTVEGKWWYQGTFTVTEDSNRSCLLTHRVHNIAPGATALLVPLLVRDTKTKHQRHLDTLAGHLASALTAGSPEN